MHTFAWYASQLVECHRSFCRFGQHRTGPNKCTSLPCVQGVPQDCEDGPAGYHPRPLLHHPGRQSGSGRAATVPRQRLPQHRLRVAAGRAAQRPIGESQYTAVLCNPSPFHVLCQRLPFFRAWNSFSAAWPCCPCWAIVAPKSGQAAEWQTDPCMQHGVHTRLYYCCRGV